MQTFLDAGYLIALYAERDQHHGEAVRHWREFRRHSPELMTTNLVVAEVVATFNSHGYHAKAVEIGHRLIVSDWIDLVLPMRNSSGPASNTSPPGRTRNTPSRIACRSS